MKTPESTPEPGRCSEAVLTPEQLEQLDKEWAENFTARCEHRSLGLFRRMSLAQKSRLLDEAKSRSITSYLGVKSLAVQLQLVEDFQEPP